jgi:hypothetical protein
LGIIITTVYREEVRRMERNDEGLWTPMGCPVLERLGTNSFTLSGGARNKL